MLRTVWNSTTSWCGRLAGSDPDHQLGWLLRKLPMIIGAIARILAKEDSFPISRIIERKEWPKTLPLEPWPVLEVVCLSELVEQANYPRRIHITKLKNHSILSGVQCLADFQIQTSNCLGRFPRLKSPQKSPCSSISLEQGALRGTAKEPSQPRPPWEYIVAQYSGSCGSQFLTETHMDQNQEPIAKSIESSVSMPMLLVSFKEGLQVLNIYSLLSGSLGHRMNWTTSDWTISLSSFLHFPGGCPNSLRQCFCMCPCVSSPRFSATLCCNQNEAS